MSKQSNLINASQDITVNSSGDVGIGTSSPTQKLMTDGNIFASTGDGGGYLLEGNSGILRQGITGMGFNTNGSERMRINGSGDVGIGTTLPTSKIHLQNASGGSGGYLKVTDAVYGGDVRLGMADGVNNDAIVGVWSNNNVKFYTNSTERMRIDASGRVTMPYQPSFRATTFTPISSSSGVIVWTTAAHNIGGHYNTSNGTFTAPVDGTYHFAGNILMDAGSSTAYIRVLFRINGVVSVSFTDSLTGGSAGAFTNYSYHAVQIAQSFYLSANDTVQMWTDNPNGSTYFATGYGSFSGFLAG